MSPSSCTLPRRREWSGKSTVGASRMSQVAESLGMTVRQFSLETGWDFSRLATNSSSWTYVMKNVLAKFFSHLSASSGVACRVLADEHQHSSKLFVLPGNSIMTGISCSARRCTSDRFTVAGTLTLSNPSMPCHGRHELFEISLAVAQTLINVATAPCVWTLTTSGDLQGRAPPS